MPCPAATPSTRRSRAGRHRPRRRVRTPASDRQTLIAGYVRRRKPSKSSPAWTPGAMPGPSPATAARTCPPTPRASAVHRSAGLTKASGLSHKSSPKAIQRPTEGNPSIPTPPRRNAHRQTGRRADDLGQKAKRVGHGVGDLDAPPAAAALRRHVTNSPDRQAARSTHAWWRRASNTEQRTFASLAHLGSYGILACWPGPHRGHR
jgi:hypothetical protein